MPVAARSVVQVRTDVDVVAAREAGRALAADVGFTRTELVLLATAVSEVARNIVRHAGAGCVELAPVREGRRAGIRIIARDSGPGIADLGQALEIGFSTARGLGLGLPACQTLMDQFDIVSAPGEGTTVEMTKWLE